MRGHHKQTRFPSPGPSHHPKRAKVAEGDTQHEALTPRRMKPNSTLPFADRISCRADASTSSAVPYKAPPTLLSRISTDDMASTLSSSFYPTSSSESPNLVYASSARSSSRSLFSAALAASVSSTSLNAGLKTTGAPQLPRSAIRSATSPSPICVEGARPTLERQKACSSSTADPVLASSHSVASSSRSDEKLTSCSPPSQLSRVSVDSAEDGLSSINASHDNAPTLRLPLVPPSLACARPAVDDDAAPIDTFASTQVPSPSHIKEAVPHQPPLSVSQAPGSPVKSNAGPSSSPPDAKQDDRPIKAEDDLADGWQLMAGAPVEDGEVKKTRIRKRHPRARGGRRVQEAKARKLARQKAQAAAAPEAGTASARVRNEVKEETRPASSVVSFAKLALASRAELVPTASGSRLSRLSTADQAVSSAHDVQPAQGISVGTEALLSGGAGRCSTTNAKLQDSQSGLDVNVRSEASVAGSKHYVREPRQVSSDPSSFIAAPCSSPSVVAAPCSVASERRQETDGKCLRRLHRSYALINRGSGASHPGIRRSAGGASKEREMEIVSRTHGVVLSAFDAFFQAAGFASRDRALRDGMPSH